VRDCSGKPTAMRNEWRGLGTKSPTRRQEGHAQTIQIIKKPFLKPIDFIIFTSSKFRL